MHSVSLQAVVESDYPGVIRAIARQLLQSQYLDVGTFLRELHHADLSELVGYCNRITLMEDREYELDSIVLLAEMLAQAEGAPLDLPDPSRAANLMILLTFEDLYRKGLIEFQHEQATLGRDLVDSTIARLK